MAFAMVVAIKPVSVNNTSRPGKKRLAEFKERLRTEAVRCMQNVPMLGGDLYARIIWFHNRQPGDPDNIIKPILDALITVVYTDDRLVAKCSSERIDIGRDYALSTADVPPEVLDALSELERLLDEQSMLGPSI